MINEVSPGGILQDYDLEKSAKGSLLLTVFDLPCARPELEFDNCLKILSGGLVTTVTPGNVK